MGRTHEWLREILTTLVGSRVHNVPRNTGEARPYSYTYGKGAQSSYEVKVALLNLQTDLYLLGAEPAKQWKIAENRDVFQDLLGLLPWRMSP